MTPPWVVMRSMTDLFMFPSPTERDLRILEQGRRIDEPDFSLTDQDRYHYTDGDGQDSKQAENRTDEKENLFWCHGYVRSLSESRCRADCGERISIAR